MVAYTPKDRNLLNFKYWSALFLQQAEHKRDQTCFQNPKLFCSIRWGCWIQLVLNAPDPHRYYCQWPLRHGVFRVSWLLFGIFVASLNLDKRDWTHHPEQVSCIMKSPELVSWCPLFQPPTARARVAFLGFIGSLRSHLLEDDGFAILPVDLAESFTELLERSPRKAPEGSRGIAIKNDYMQNRQAITT